MNNNIQSAECVLTCTELDQTLTFYSDTLGMKIEAIYPADNPKIAVLSGYGIRIRLEIKAQKNSTQLRLLCQNPLSIVQGKTSLLAPNGTVIELVAAETEIVIPAEQPSFVLTQLTDDAKWVRGRAGMRYRDLIPNRQGGRFIASHIQIQEGGPVPDYVHFHKVRFQLIYCYKGWVKVVYQDQGEAFILEAGDCVLQPPQIRHRVLESSAGLEVVEIGCPAEHETFADPNLDLPNSDYNPERDFSGQQFVHHIAKKALWKAWRIEGFECRDSGIGKATKGLASVKVIRPNTFSTPVIISHQEEFLFFFILCGKLSFITEALAQTNLNAGDCLLIPRYLKHSIISVSDDLQLLEVSMSEEFKTTEHKHMF